MSAALRLLPSVHELLDQLSELEQSYPRDLILRTTRQVIEEARQNLRTSGETSVPDIAGIIRDRLRSLEQPSLRHVINATGVVLHTNLGRAPLLEGAFPSGYTNLEYDLGAGARGKRDVHIGLLIEQLLGVPGIAVNNNAAAVYLALNELAAGGEVIVSRGELIEIGDGFRIPDIMARSGATLREVGTTNRTRVEDYANAISERTRLLMMVHPSNFRIEGFTAKPERRQLVDLAKRHNLPIYEDLGSGCLADLRDLGIEEPRVQDSLEHGVTLVSFSGDKLLGGPQAGILAGEASVVARLRRNPMFRAFRLDKLILSVLESTLRNTLLERWHSIPALAMIRMPALRIRERAEALLRQVRGLDATLVEGKSVIGGGSTPEQSIPTWLISIGAANVVEAERKLRASDPPVTVRIEDDRILIDLRTVLPEEEDDLVEAVSRL